ncbi:unnamed protein product [Merluccius merluccius]
MRNGLCDRLPARPSLPGCNPAAPRGRRAPDLVSARNPGEAEDYLPLDTPSATGPPSIVGGQRQTPNKPAVPPGSLSLDGVQRPGPPPETLLNAINALRSDRARRSRMHLS